MNKPEIKLRYLSLHHGARLFFKENIRYFMEANDQGHSGVFHGEKEYTLTFIILEVLSLNAKTLEQAYIILKPFELLSEEEADKVYDEINNSKSLYKTDIVRYHLLYHNEYLGFDPVQEGWAVLEK